MHLQRPPRLRHLNRLVEHFWVFLSEPHDSFELVLPSGRIQLLVNLRNGMLSDFDTTGALRSQTGAMALQGPTTRPRMLDASQQEAICGISFRPGGAFFLAPMADELTDRVLDLDHFWPGCSTRLFHVLRSEYHAHRLLDQLERELAFRLGASEPDKAFALAAKMLRHGHLVIGVEKALGLTPHQLRRLFRAHAGIEPKKFSRIERFRRLVRNMPHRTSWAQLALDNGFVDQAHMIREFKAFSGTTPARYRAAAPNKPTHYKIEAP